jgi:N-acetylglucosamine kinase-like BadF-type ATPase
VSDGLPAVLAIDGGNSKTDVALVAGDGTLLAAARGPGVPDKLSDQTVLILGELIWSAAGDAGRAAGGAGRRGAAGPAVARDMIACVANVDLPEEEHQLGEMLSACGWSETTHVANDTFAVLRAGVDCGGPHWGVAVTCGAGINCVGLAPDGKTTRFLALGEITGDWGGGLGLGKAALWWAIRAEDGRGPYTLLRETVPAYFGVPRVSDVAIGIHQGKIQLADLGWLPPVLFDAALRGDAVACDLVSRLADEVCAMALTAIRRLGLTGLAVPVVLGGGVLAARNPLLIDKITERMAGAAPQATMRIAGVPPIAGAALLGLDHVGAPHSAEARLRAAYPPG